MNRTILPFALGLDIGGSSVKWAAVDAVGGPAPRVIDRGLLPIEQARTPEEVIGALGRIADGVRAEIGQPASIGVGLPGIFDEETGSPTLLPNFPDAWHGYPLAAALEKRLSQRIVLVNDAKAFSVAESLAGAAAGYRLVACAVLGTGVGGGIVANGALVRGRGTAGELGHLTVDLDGPQCGCGNNGCVEAFASAAAISERAAQPTAQKAFEAAWAGDGRAREAVDRAVRALGAGLANVFITLAPDAFVIGGGQAETGAQLIELIRAEIQRRVRVAPASQINVLPAALGRFAGAIGAALMSGGEAPPRLP